MTKVLPFVAVLLLLAVGCYPGDSSKSGQSFTTDGGKAVSGKNLKIPPEPSLFKEFASVEGRYKVQMPGTPKEQTRVVNGDIIKVCMLEERDVAYAASYNDLKDAIGESEAQVQGRLDGARDGLAQSLGAKITGESMITLGKYPGREVVGDIPSKNLVVRTRFYVVDGWLYQVMVIGKQSWATSATATKFLDSFALTQ